MSSTDKQTLQAESMYDEYRFGQFSYTNKRNKYDPLLFEILSNNKQVDLLCDIGCGAGYWMQFVYPSFGISKEKMIGVDLAPGNIKQLTERGFNAKQGDIVDIPVDSDSAYITVCNGVLMYASDIEKAFRELVRITKTGGQIYLNVYNAWHPYNYLIYKPTYPFRYLYYNGYKNIANIVYYLVKPFMQFIAYISLGELLDENTAKTICMDQLFSPRQKYFTKAMIEKLARDNYCVVRSYDYNRYTIMIAAAIVVNKK